MDRSLNSPGNYPDRIFLCLAGFTAGILLFYSGISILLLCLAIFSILLLIKRCGKRFFYLLLFFLGGFFTSFFHARIPGNHIINSDITAIDRLSGRVLSVRKSFFSERYLIEACGYTDTAGTRGEVSGKVLLTAGRGGSEPCRGSLIEALDVNLRKIPLPGNPGGFNRRQLWSRRGVYVEGKAGEVAVITSSDRNFLNLFFTGIRNRLTLRLGNLFSHFPEERALLETVTIGKPEIPHFLKEAGKRSGTYHLLVISGLHLAFLLLFFRILFIPFRNFNNRHPGVFPLLSFLLLWLYAGIAGFRPPVTRAALMLSFFFLGELFEREVSGFSSLSMAALLLLFLNPSNLFDASFQLSFAATAGIIFVVQRYRLADGKNLAKGVVICGLGAQVSVLPLIIYHFGIFYPAGFISNILFFPLAGLVVIAFPLLLLMPFLFVPVRMLLSFFLYSVTLVAQISPGIKVSLSLPLLILSYVFLLLLFADMGIKRKACALSAVFCGAMILAVLPSLLPFRENKLYILSAGKPAAVFVDDREAACFFSDSHRPPEVENVLIPFLKTRKGVRSFNLFYNDITYNHAGTLKAIGKAVEPWTVFEHESAGNEPFYDYYKKIFQGFPAMDFRLMKTGDRESLCAMEVEFLGEDGGRLAYLARKGEETILIAPYVGEVISRKLAGRTFTIAYISDFRNTADIRNVLGCTRYGYLVLPKKLKKFSVLNVPDGKTLYLSNGAVVTDFSAEPFAVSYYRDAFTADFRRNWKRLFFPGFLRREGLSLR